MDKQTANTSLAVYMHIRKLNSIGQYLTKDFKNYLTKVIRQTPNIGAIYIVKKKAEQEKQMENSEERPTTRLFLSPIIFNVYTNDQSI